MNNTALADGMHTLTTTKRGHRIYVNLLQSPAAIHISQQPHLLSLATKLLKDIELSGKRMTIEHDFKRNIGNTQIVETHPNDNVVYAKRLNQTTYSKFVRKRELVTSTYLSMAIYKDNDSNYELHDVWVGRYAPPFPGTKEETIESRSFWENHAIILEGQAIQLRTLIKTNPFL